MNAMQKKLSANELDFVRSNAERKTDRQIGEILGIEARDVMRERLRLGVRKSWSNAWQAGRNEIDRKADERDKWKRRSDCGRSKEKAVVLISDVQTTQRPEILEITLAEDGRKVRVRRDLVEFFTGRAVLPLWYWRKVIA